METSDLPPNRPPPPPPPQTKPKIFIQIPDTPQQRGPMTAGDMYWAPFTPFAFRGRPPGTPGSHISDPNKNAYFNPFLYNKKASDFMLKRFAGFKDFTMNTAKSGLSVGEKTALWLVYKLRSLSKKWFTHFFLTLCLLLYSVLGAVVFMTLEGPNEIKYDKKLADVRKEVAANIRQVVLTAEPDEEPQAFYARIEKHLLNYEESYAECMKHVNNNNNVKKTWSFWNSMFYAGTIYTTIGYGHIAPKTTSGRVATIIYALIGIPLFLIVLADFGKLFTRIIKFFWSFIRRFYYTRSCRKVRRTAPVQEVMKGLNIVYDVVRRPSQIFNEEDLKGQENLQVLQPLPPLPPKPGVVREIDIEREPETPAPSVFEIDDEFNLPISVAIFILVVYIIIGALCYNLWESWDFFESFYFVFISMSTIGLGDLVPDHPMFMMASILYLVFGLALTSMCINVVQLKLTNTFRQASAKLGATIGLQVAEEDGSFVAVAPQPEIVPIHKGKQEIEDNKFNDQK